MNKQERDILGRLRILLNKIPAGHSGLGAPTRSLVGINKAHDDFVQARVATRLIMTALVEHDLRFEGADNPMDAIKCFESWIDDRREHNWEFPIPDFYRKWISREEA